MEGSKAKEGCPMVDKEFTPRAYFSVDNPATAVTLLIAMGALILYMIGAETGPIKERVTNNEKADAELKQTIKDGFKQTYESIEGIRQIIISSKPD